MKLVTAIAQGLTVGVLTAVTGSATAQQDYPTRPIRFIVGFAAALYVMR